MRSFLAALVLIPAVAVAAVESPLLREGVEDHRQLQADAPRGVFTEYKEPLYKGCFKDLDYYIEKGIDIGRDVVANPDWPKGPFDMEKQEVCSFGPEWCKQKCKNSLPDEFTYMALGNYDECYCTDRIIDLDWDPWRPVLSAQCNYPCPGDPTKECGGKDRYSLYELSDLVYDYDDYEPDDEHDDAWYEDD